VVVSWSDVGESRGSNRIRGTAWVKRDILRQRIESNTVAARDVKAPKQKKEPRQHDEREGCRLMTQYKRKEIQQT
jgi:hypothetical protein